jgi:hypothetical protein
LILARLEKSEGGRPAKNSPDTGGVSEYAKVLENTETTKQDASRRQKIAEMPKERFEARGLCACGIA